MKSVQIPDEVYQQASKLAEQDHVSVDRLIAVLVGQGVGDWARMKERASRGSMAKFHAVLAKVGNVMPDPIDQL